MARQLSIGQPGRRLDVPMADLNLYQILAVGSDAEMGEIRRAYYRLALEVGLF